MKAHRLGGPVWWLAMLWVGLGAAGSVYAFVCSAQRLDFNNARVPAWVGEPAMIGDAAEWGAVIWLVLTIPVLAAGFIQLGRTKPPDEGRRLAWVCTWMAGVALMSLAVILGQDTPRATYSCSPTMGCGLNAYGPAVVIWGELLLCAVFLALGAIVTWVLAKPAQPRPTVAAPATCPIER
jgi:hypothetical protein